jgi:hypothetical protein
MKQTKCDNCGISDDLTKDTYRGRRWHKSASNCVAGLRARVAVLESQLKEANEDAVFWFDQSKPHYEWDEKRTRHICVFCGAYSGQNHKPKCLITLHLERIAKEGKG